VAFLSRFRESAGVEIMRSSPFVERVWRSVRPRPAHRNERAEVHRRDQPTPPAQVESIRVWSTRRFAGEPNLRTPQGLGLPASLVQLNLRVFGW